MSDDVIKDVKLEISKLETEAEEAQSEQPQTNQDSFSEVEKEAYVKGWRPQGPKSAEEYLRAEPLYAELKVNRKKIKEMEDTVRLLSNHMKKQEAYGYQRALDDMKAQRDNAIYEGDVAAVNQLDNEIRKTEHEMNAVAAAPTVDPVVEEFKSKYSDWMNEQTPEADDMRLLAEAKYLILKQNNAPQETIFSTIEESLIRAYPHRFNKEPDVPGVLTPNPVAGGARQGIKKYTFHDLNHEQKISFRHFEKQGLFTLDEYIKELVKLGEIK